LVAIPHLAARVAPPALRGAVGQQRAGVIAAGREPGHGTQILNQLIGTAIAWTLAIVGTLIILKVCDVLLGLRVTPEQEIEGLDLALHGEEGYIMEA